MGDWEEIIKWGMIGSLAYALLKSLQERGGRTMIHRCPRCNFMVIPNQQNCPQCGLDLNWGAVR